MRLTVVVGLSVLLATVLLPLVSAQDGDPGSSAPPALDRWVRLVDKPLTPQENPFRLSVWYDSTGAHPRVELLPDLRPLLRRQPLFASYQTTRKDDTTLSILISITDRPAPAGPIELPMAGETGRTILQLVHRSDTALFVIHLDSVRVDALRKAPFVKLVKVGKQ